MANIKTEIAGISEISQEVADALLAVLSQGKTELNQLAAPLADVALALITDGGDVDDQDQNQELADDLVAKFLSLIGEPGQRFPKVRMLQKEHLRKGLLEKIFATKDFSMMEQGYLSDITELFQISIEFLRETTSASHKSSIEKGEARQLRGKISKSKITDEDSSLKVCMHLSLAELPLFVNPTNNGMALVNFVQENQTALKSLSGTITEGNYTSAMLPLPDHMIQSGNGPTAKTVFPELYSETESRYIRPSPDCKPELALRSAKMGRMTVSVEWKSFDEGGIEELLQACSGCCQSTYFSNDDSRPSGQSWKFYAHPPSGLGALFVGPTAVAVFAYEMVGYLLFSIYDSGSSLGTAQANAMFQATKDSTEEVTCAVDLSEYQVSFQSCETIGTRARWSTTSVNSKFYKLLRYDRYKGGDDWRRLCKVYQAYEAIRDLPKALVPSRLLYGEYQVAIEMEFCTNNTPLSEEQNLTEKEVVALQQALQTLAKADLCYTDFRPQNILRVDGESDGDCIRLIDYDDMLIVPNDGHGPFYAGLLASGDLDLESPFYEDIRRVLGIFVAPMTPS